MSPGPRFRPRRPLGSTGFVATRLGAGDLADRAIPFETCVATLRRALDAGLNVVDTAPSYEDGYSEEIVGAAVRDRRAQVFVTTKIDHFDRAVAPQLSASLGRLGLDRVDLAVFHSVSTLDAWRAISSARGPFAELEAERAAGRARFVGISSHHPDVLDLAIRAGACDVVLFPIGPYVDERYELEILPLARSRNVGTIAFKTFGAGKLLSDTLGYQRPLADAAPGSQTQRALPHLVPAECVHYTLTRDPDVALLGLSDPAEQDQAFRAAEAFEAPLAAAELARIRSQAAEAVRGKGPIWWNPSGS
ncbi:MAG: aldo/keto reductase [Planctomycetota bacterium]|nr:aldo/keto reductase [Planctomycetota bacterium]